MSRLHIYTVHINPSLAQPYEAAEFIEEGFNWKAFIFSGLWTLYHRLWWPAFIIFASIGLTFYLEDAHRLSHAGFLILNFFIHLIVGFHANDWLRAKLKRRGRIMADIVTGDSLLRAEQRFFDRYFAASPPFVA